MAKVSFNFRVLAVDESDHWDLSDSILADVPVFGCYLICEGERTHICSLSASSRADFIENVFRTETEEQHEEAGEWIHENGGELGTYFDYVDVKAARRYVSDRIRVTLDSRDYELDSDQYGEELARARRWESPQKAHATARHNCMRDHAWEAAAEYVRQAPPAPPVLLDSAEYEAHRRDKAMREARASERSYGPPPLFAYAGIDAPLALG